MSSRARGTPPAEPSSFGKRNRARKDLTIGLFSKKTQTFDALFLHGLQDIYYAEQEIVKALPKLIQKATNRDLTKGLKSETKNQITRLDQAFKKLGQIPKGIRCPGIDGLITAGDEIAGEVADKEVLDAAIVGATQSVAYYAEPSEVYGPEVGTCSSTGPAQAAWLEREELLSIV